MSIVFHPIRQIIKTTARAQLINYEYSEPIKTEKTNINEVLKEAYQLLLQDKLMHEIEIFGNGFTLQLGQNGIIRGEIDESAFESFEE